MNTILHGDCLELMKGIPNGSIDMILCDLPYGTTQNKWDSIIPFDLMWNQYKRIIKTTGIIALTASQPFSSALVMSNPLMFKHEWIWIKNKGSNFANTVREPFKEHEQVLIFSNGKWTYNKQMQQRTNSGLDRVKYKFHLESKTKNYREFKGRGQVVMPELRVPSSWQKIKTENGLHPTQKPTALFEYLIKTYTNEGDLVLDNCGGSGTTAIACLKTNRNFIVMEKEKKYYDIIQDRVSLYKSNIQMSLFRS